jgi:hypothetical protein
MAKTSTKTATKSAAKTTTKTTASKAKPKTTDVSVEKVTEEVLRKLQELGIEQQLQSDIEWCLGSYRADGNPVGLFEMLERSITVFNAEKAKKTKGITAKLIGDLEKVVKSK